MSAAQARSVAALLGVRRSKAHPADAFDLAAEHVTQAEERARPQDCAQGIVEKETPCTHVKDACEGRRDGADPWKKFRKDE